LTIEKRNIDFASAVSGPKTVSVGGIDAAKCGKGVLAATQLLNVPRQSLIGAETARIRNNIEEPGLKRNTGLRRQ
jgi:hypothetical protein